jgi:hypothetical protein
MELFENTQKGAVISEDGKYRYQLWRIWDESKPLILFMMLNPSTADADKDGLSIRRCINFAKDWGAGGFYVGNLCAFRSSNPKDLLKESDPIGENTHHIAEMVKKTMLVVCAWGNSPVVKKIFTKGNEMIIFNYLQANLFYIELSQDGTPKHPLYLRKELEPKQWHQNLIAS